MMGVIKNYVGCVYREFPKAMFNSLCAVFIGDSKKDMILGLAEALGLANSACLQLCPPGWGLGHARRGRGVYGRGRMVALYSFLERPVCGCP